MQGMLCICLFVFCLLFSNCLMRFVQFSIGNANLVGPSGNRLLICINLPFLIYITSQKCKMQREEKKKRREGIQKIHTKDIDSISYLICIINYFSINFLIVEIPLRLFILNSLIERRIFIKFKLTLDMKWLFPYE